MPSEKLISDFMLINYMLFLLMSMYVLYNRILIFSFLNANLTEPKVHKISVYVRADPASIHDHCGWSNFQT